MFTVNRQQMSRFSTTDCSRRKKYHSVILSKHNLDYCYTRIQKLTRHANAIEPEGSLTYIKS